MRNFSKRFLTMLLAVAMVFSLSGMTAFAADGETSTYDVGAAPEQNADGQYEIASVENLEWFADQVNSGNNSIDGIVTADIDASDSESFRPIGTSDSAFQGTFDGDGHTITLNINNPDEDYQALFGDVYTAVISNVTVDGSVSGSQYVAGIIAYMDGSNISGCVNNAAITSTSYYTGGVVGYAYTRNGLGGLINGTITNCGNDGEITADTRYVGGIAGYTKADGNESTTISGCYNHADIVAQYDIGGIVGYGSSATSVDSCYNTGNITETGTSGSNSYLSGGLIGMFYGNTPVSNAFNTGTVTGGNNTRQHYYVGALVGGGTNPGGSASLDHAYYLEGSCLYEGVDRYYGPNGSGTVTVVNDSVASKTAEEMQEIEFLDLVNGSLAYTLGTDHPILTWETEERTSYMALREEYNEDLLLDWADYTSESWASFEEVLEAAGALLDDPNASDEQLDEMLIALREAKGALEWIEADYTVKYAVSIYDINKDVDEDGNTLGLTFGPATASHSYVRDYNAHLTQEEYESGEGVCLHWMSWKDIVRQSKEDPEAFRDCMNNGCTHSIDIELNDTLLNPNYSFVRMIGDGCGILYYSIANSYLQVNYGNSDLHNYGATTFRTTLNTASYSLLSCFPEDLQNGIVARKVSYAQTAGSSIAEYCYDKLWLFSLYELGQGGTPVEGSQYYRPTSENAYNSESNRTYKLYNYYENGDYGDWMLPRSLYGEYDKSIYNVHYLGDGEYGTITGGGSGGLSPGFCLAGPEEDQELSAFAVYSEDDGSLTFYTDYTVPTKGNTYNDKTVTTVYKDVEQTAAASADDIPWSDVCTDVTDVVIDATFADAQPTSFAYWFDGFSNAAFSGLAYMDTTNVTSMSYMFHDCAALTRLDLSDWDTTSVTDGEQFATGCPDLQWVKIGEDTNIFTLSQNVDQPDWYDSRTNGNLVSSNYLMDVTEAGTYWSYTEETEGYITIKVGDETSVLTHETIDAAIADAERDTFTCGSQSVTARFVLLRDLIGIDYDFCSYTVTAAEDDYATSGLPTDTYLYKTEDGAYRTAVNGGPESQWVSDPDTIEVVVEHTWGDIEWTWTGLPLYCTTDNPDFEPLSVTGIQPWNVVESLNIATLAGDTIDAAAKAAATCKACGETETVDAVLTAEYLSDEPTEYVGALAEITATATFSDGQKATDAVKVIAPATGELEVNYMREDETVATDAVPYANINELINKTEPFAIQYISSGGRDTELTMPFVSITDALGMSEDENFCCFYAHGEDGFTVTIPADAYLYQRNEADSSNNSYYYRTAVGITPERTIVRSSQAFVSYVSCIDVQYMHQWGTPEWTWSDDHSSAVVTVACTKENESGLAVCNYSETVDATIDVTTEGGYTVYTATATLVDGTVVTDVQRVEVNREAFAVYSADDNSLIFAYDNVPAVGGQYDGKTVTAVYDNVNSVSVTSSTDIPWNSLAADITSVTIDASFNEAQPTSLRFWFYRMENATFSGLENIDTSEVTTLDSMFEGCTALETVDLSGWNTSNVTTMCGIFNNCYALTSVDVSGWDTSGVTEMSYLFSGCTALETLDLSDWDTTAVTSCSSFALGGTAPACVKLGENTDIFTKGQLIGTQIWYDSPTNGTIASSNYLQDAAYPGEYWSDTTLAEPTVRDVTIESNLTDNTKTYDGAGANLRVSATVTPEDATVSYAWYKVDEGGSETLLDADGSVFTTGSSVADSGTYKCVVTAVNAAGEMSADDTIVITIVKAAQDISYAQTEIEKTVGDNAFTNPLTETKVSSDADAGVAYASSDPGVATVDAITGEVTIFAAGETTITATAQETANYTGASASYKLTVTAAEPEPEPVQPTVSDVTITSNLTDNTKTYDGSGANLTVAAQVTPDNAEVTYQWYGPDGEAIDGAVSSVFTTGSSVADSGTYKCVLTATNDGLTAAGESEITITVTAAAQEISFAEPAITKTVGDEPFTNELIETKVDTEGGAAIRYESSDEAIATADENGQVTILSEGGVTITASVSATANYAEAAASYELTIEAAQEPTPTVDKEILEVAIANAEALNKGDYTEESWNAMQTALDAAKAVDEDGDATQSEVDQATIDLMAAIAGLEIAGEEPDNETDKADLLKEYTDAMGLSESDYTQESWAPFANALKDAQEVLLNADATQEDIEAASEALKTAMDNLVKKPADSGTGGEPKNGLCRITSGELWGYYVDDKVDTNYTGFAHNDNGDWWVVNGYVRFDTNSVEKDTTGKNGDKGVNEKGAWWYVIGNKVQHGFTGLANYRNANGWWYIQDGKVDFSHNGVDKNVNGWWYVLDGKVRFDFTGLANYKNANGWWYISGGKVNFNHNGVDHNKNGWWYVTGGKVQFGFTGLANYRNENGWWYIKDGKVDFTYTGRASNKNGTWNVVNGKVIF